MSGPARSYDRTPDDLRPTTIEPGFVRTATGSALISMGETRVICTASVQETVPRWLELDTNALSAPGQSLIYGNITGSAYSTYNVTDALYVDGIGSQTGVTIQVPLFVETGDRVKVDTRTGEYLTRVQ